MVRGLHAGERGSEVEGCDGIWRGRCGAGKSVGWGVLRDEMFSHGTKFGKIAKAERTATRT